MKTLIDYIGNTPLVKITEVNGKNIYAKLEYFNPTGSIKDRTVSSIILNNMKDGKIKKGDTIVEATSGNTGIALAMMAKQLGLKAIIVMPASMSKERIDIIKAFGAEIILTKEGGIAHSNEVAQQLCKENGYFPLQQFSSPYNKKTHYENTAREIFEQLPEVDAVISGFGTAGTVMGIQEYVKDNKKNTTVYALEPAESALVTKGVAGPHKIQGLGANFISDILDVQKIDNFITCESDKAIEYAKSLIRDYSIMSGISGGAAFAGALEVAKSENNHKNILFIIPDRSDRYASLGIYE